MKEPKKVQIGLECHSNKSNAFVKINQIKIEKFHR